MYLTLCCVVAAAGTFGCIFLIGRTRKVRQETFVVVDGTLKPANMDGLDVAMLFTSCLQDSVSETEPLLARHRKISESLI